MHIGEYKNINVETSFENSKHLKKNKKIPLKIMNRFIVEVGFSACIFMTLFVYFL